MVGVSDTSRSNMTICLENPRMKSKRIKKTNRVIGSRVFACSIHHINSQWQSPLQFNLPKNEERSVQIEVEIKRVVAMAD